MADTLESLARAAIQLPQEQRLELVRKILESIDSDCFLHPAWQAEVQERIRRYDAGETEAIPGWEVFAELDRRLAQQ